jgi:hypothetical protein
MLISAVITGLELYVGIKTGETPNPFGFFDDIGRELKEGNAEGVIEIFENLKKSTKIYETKNGEKVAIVEYNGGIYAVYNQKIWGIDIINEGLNLDIAADVLTGWFEDNSLKNVKMS